MGPALGALCSCPRCGTHFFARNHLEFPARLGIVWFPRRPTTIGPRTILAARSGRLSGGVTDSDGRSGSFADAFSEPSYHTGKRSNGEAAFAFYSSLHARAAGS